MKSDDVIIVVCGPTGIGKSTLINSLIGTNVARTSSSIESCTKDFLTYITTEHRFMDTIGFQDQRGEVMDDESILKNMLISIRTMKLPIACFLLVLPDITRVDKTILGYINFISSFNEDLIKRTVVLLPRSKNPNRAFKRLQDQLMEVYKKGEIPFFFELNVDIDFDDETEKYDCTKLWNAIRDFGKDPIQANWREDECSNCKKVMDSRLDNKAGDCYYHPGEERAHRHDKIEKRHRGVIKKKHNQSITYHYKVTSPYYWMVAESCQGWTYGWYYCCNQAASHSGCVEYFSCCSNRSTTGCSDYCNNCQAFSNESSCMSFCTSCDQPGSVRGCKSTNHIFY